MSVRFLSSLFEPASVAVVGASNKPDTLGYLAMRNLLAAGFAGPIMPVTKDAQAIAGVLAYPDPESLPVAPDLALLCAPPATLPQTVLSLGQKGAKVCVVMSDMGEGTSRHERHMFEERLLACARESRMRLLGPGSLGVQTPGIGLNASVFTRPALEGKVAFVSQSGALCTSVLDWARGHGIGFSHFVSLGNKTDIDYGDVIDYLSSNVDVRAILLHIEGLTDTRKFMSAGRSAARNKPVIVIKTGRGMEEVRQAVSHTGTLAGSDAIYDIAFQRAGMLRVYSLEELFSAVETLAHIRRPTRGPRLAVVTNGRGLGVMAVDSLVTQGGTLARLEPETKEALARVLPGGTLLSANPVDLGGAASPEVYSKVMEVLFKAREVDAVLVVYAPYALSAPLEIAREVIDVAKRHRSASLFTCWVGHDQVEEARAQFTEAEIPTFPTPDDAIQGFMHLVTYRKNQHMLMETPRSCSQEFEPDLDKAREIIDEAIAQGNLTMSEPEAKGVFEAYGIPVVETAIARTPQEAAEVARTMEGPYALKIVSRAITHKSDVGGVVLDLQTPEDVEKAAGEMAERVHSTYPEAALEGFTVQHMARRAGSHELIVGATADPIFGPVLLFGEGGTAVEIIRDQAVALAPLNMALARDMLERTRVFRLLEGYRDHKAVNIDAICLTLIQLSQMLIDIPEIVEMEINPLFAGSDGVLAVDARMRLDPGRTRGPHRLAIRPYPSQLESTEVMRDGRTVMVRPIRPEDEAAYYDFVAALTPEDARFRFFGQVKAMPHDQMARLTQIDYAREMAFVAELIQDDGQPCILGSVQALTDPDNETTEFAVVVRSDLKGSGLGRLLMLKIIRYCKERRTRYMDGQVLRDNRRMLRFCESLGFRKVGLIDEDTVELRLDLSAFAPEDFADTQTLVRAADEACLRT
ncbi:bifunctional acetate--CoA ligase family protein/GNAT family N-acetyltransferase [Phaeovibrio sulfidiphilus]|uniref:Bifunctional acetate--CoA ligase family protein/GNAT family N-acetyltransferase n=1 Tax=Phaeovibrio sulfidiphilus TaxID=1220600 RepID=A0A8J6YYI2_9PROT|nr:bifunctional acetate--CoA ligase family protein/GNAT family N-acetyltransferase [Phaeovibrio sulfidiphilus]MBE1236878.1 bifunctional acetate--CoA ligase family protein/GNAT family N-acetyltransferase [Phaeovibrio sulfidiphilus]